MSRSIHRTGGVQESVTWRRGDGVGAGVRDVVHVRCEPDSYDEGQMPRTGPTLRGHVLDCEHVV